MEIKHSYLASLSFDFVKNKVDKIKIMKSTSTEEDSV